MVYGTQIRVKEIQEKIRENQKIIFTARLQVCKQQYALADKI